MQNPGVAKFGIALEWGSRGRWFESSHSDQVNRSNICYFGFFVVDGLEPILMQYIDGARWQPVRK